MFLALSRGIAEAGLMFALAMMLGVGATLCLVAALTVLAREWVIGFTSRHGGSVERASRVLEAVTGVALVVIGGWELLRH